MRSRIAVYCDGIPANLSAERRRSIQSQKLKTARHRLPVMMEVTAKLVAGWSHDGLLEGVRSSRHTRRVTLKCRHSHTRSSHISRAAASQKGPVWQPHTRAVTLAAQRLSGSAISCSRRTTNGDDRAIWPALSRQLTIRPGSRAVIADCGDNRSFIARNGGIGRFAATSSTISENGDHHFVTHGRRRRRLSPLLARLQATS
jgi:hypothetical protein